MLLEWLMAVLVSLKVRWSIRRNTNGRFPELQVEILLSRLPGNQVISTPVEGRRLLKLGPETDHAVEDTLGTISIRIHRHCPSTVSTLVKQLDTRRRALRQRRLSHCHGSPAVHQRIQFLRRLIRLDAWSEPGHRRRAGTTASAARSTTGRR